MADPTPAIRAALEHLPETCRYHGVNFGKLGWEGWPGPGSVPRCDSCKPAHARAVALRALDHLRDEVRRWVPGATGYGSGSVSSRG